MKNQEYWQQFVKTGDVLDYLNYVACTCEDVMNRGNYEESLNTEGDCNVNINSCDRDGSIRHAYW